MNRKIKQKKTNSELTKNSSHVSEFTEMLENML